ncbi:hypothetical protein TNCV_2754341 [Trichonephila clavipes]|nr:hypothetical protein TNCV_2754341 [Trichonephila clavipes]
MLSTYSQKHGNVYEPNLWNYPGARFLQFYCGCQSMREKGHSNIFRITRNFALYAFSGQPPDRSDRFGLVVSYVLPKPKVPGSILLIGDLDAEQRNLNLRAAVVAPSTRHKSNQKLSDLLNAANKAVRYTCRNNQKAVRRT